MKYQLVIFDMDGTLADTSPGIYNSHRYAHKMMGRQEPTNEELDGIIGGPLLKNYRERFGFSETDARKAVEFYRDYYAENGIYQAELYSGMGATLRKLHDLGIYLGVATLKAERFAKIMLKNMSVYDCFDAICGMDEHDTRTKAQLIKLCMEKVGVSSTDTILVGDSIHDLNGAKECCIDFLGVTYGFGFVDTDTIVPSKCKVPEEIMGNIV